MKDTLKKVRDVALTEGCTKPDAPVYLNYSLQGTNVQDIYHTDLEKLGKLRKKYDENDVMGQTGGFKIPLA
ncbi:hypothetical protein FRB94_002601 [Tulasnella sp. JGI-2019a]|nr:hypothetical protein FRB93_008186 [Tulasnella sp. JGI-2019a]KAG8986696.1 hypothetical protein FRB94_002601 [Tulasnella sp. JGI-2019a]KAG9027097.1 hypothetical protein FRB95_008145 [Tulasnella sp. JGI-2019a]